MKTALPLPLVLAFLLLATAAPAAEGFHGRVLFFCIDRLPAL